MYTYVARNSQCSKTSLVRCMLKEKKKNIKIKQIIWNVQKENFGEKRLETSLHRHTYVSSICSMVMSSSWCCEDTWFGSLRNPELCSWSGQHKAFLAWPPVHLAKLNVACHAQHQEYTLVFKLISPILAIHLLNTRWPLLPTDNVANRQYVCCQRQQTIQQLYWLTGQYWPNYGYYSGHCFSVDHCVA